MYFFLLRSVLRGALDVCILPGTMTGSEILWVYLVSWRREAAGVIAAVLSGLFAGVDMDQHEVAPATGPESGD